MQAARGCFLLQRLGVSCASCQRLLNDAVLACCKCLHAQRVVGGGRSGDDDCLYFIIVQCLLDVASDDQTRVLLVIPGLDFLPRIHNETQVKLRQLIQSPDVVLPPIPATKRGVHGITLQGACKRTLTRPLQQLSSLVQLSRWRPW